jgi:hypothetical protein
MLSRAFRKTVRIGFSAISLLAFAISAQANNLIVNGSFESITTGPNGPGQFDDSFPYTLVPGWDSTGYNFIFGPGSADTTGSWTSEFNASLTLWGPNNGSNNGLPATSPDGGNFLAADGAYQIGAVTQTISGLTIGDSYALSFYWAGAQQNGFDGPNTEQWAVSFGSQEQDTVVLNNADHGFTGWQFQTFTFTADNTSDLLSFLAVGTPNGVPPFSLLDGVTLNDTSSTPEPGTVILVVGGLMAALGARRLKRSFKR